MTILTAKSLGMCFGVRDALAATRRIERPACITINGELVHNPLVNAALEARGFARAPEGGDVIPDTPSVLITAHGIGFSASA